jgi:hypothetical protein
VIAYQIYGHHAIRIAERDGVVLRAYTQPELGNQIFLSLDQARQAVADNVRTVFCEVVPIGWSNGMPSGRNVDDYFRHGQYLGPDEDGIEPRWAEASKATLSTPMILATPFTPGPWQIYLVAGDPWPKVIAGDPSAGCIICNVNPESGVDASKAPSIAFHRMPAMANARLLAAAPDLLVALEALLHGLRKVTSQADWNAEREEASAMARAAIAKAKGRE